LNFRSFKAGEVLFREGTIAKYVLFVQKGEIELLKTTNQKFTPVDHQRKRRFRAVKIFEEMCTKMIINRIQANKLKRYFIFLVKGWFLRLNCFKNFAMYADG
jgi:hypothetical protein